MLCSLGQGRAHEPHPVLSSISSHRTSCGISDRTSAPALLKAVALHPHARRQHQSQLMYVTEPLYTERAYVVELNHNETVEKVGLGADLFAVTIPFCAEECSRMA
jgi:hypothetical protein